MFLPLFVWFVWGYKLHVRSATLHSILVAISKVQQEADESTEGVITLSFFDRCVPAMLDLIHQGESVVLLNSME